jgi:pyruvate kinase
MAFKPKIICTIGPASYRPEILRTLKERGVDFFRINLSHTYEEEIEEKILELKKYGVPIIIDTEGSQIRTGNKDEFFIKEGDDIIIYNKNVSCNERNIFLTPLEVINEFQIGDLILVDFNSALLKVADTSKLKFEGYIKCKVLIGGSIGGRKAVHIDGFSNLPAFSKKDFKAIELAKKYNINTFTLSFIRKKEDVELFRKIYPESIIYSKIEVKSAILELDEILKLSEGILIDRGDLSKEIPVEKIPFTQKYILDKARKMGKEAFVATNTLEKMSSSLKPDKSEANDIINTFLDGATGIALTKETATGRYPIETVNMLLALINQFDALGLDEHSSKEEIIKKMMEKDYFDDHKIPSLLVSPHGGKLVYRVLKNIPNEQELSLMKRLIVDERVIMDAEQISVGSFSPIEGFMNKKDFDSVLDEMRLSNGVIWPLPIILQVNEEISKKFSPGEKILLVYEKDNQSYATLDVDEIYKIDKEDVVKKWFGTNNLNHPGVKQIISSGDYLIGGKVNLIKRRESPYKLYELTPSQTRRIFSERGWKNVVGFHTRNAIHCSHEFVQMEAMKIGFCDGLFVHPVIGKKKKGDFETEIIVKTYEKMINDIYPKEKVVFSAFPTFSRYAGPREALFTALTRKNFGCSHFVVGRDHTGVGEFYHPKASHKIFDKFSKEELGIIPIKFDKVFYSEIEKKHLHEPEHLDHPEDKKLQISGTQAREMFKNGIKPPEWFMRPEISEIIINKLKNNEKVFVEEENSLLLTKNNKVLWFTGLSGSGKTTLAEGLKEILEKKNMKVLILDGDIIRKDLHKQLGFTPDDIKENNRLISEICLKEKGNYDFILVPIISPFQESRENARKRIGEGFVEVFVNCPIEECIKRDPKGNYKKAMNGEIKHFIGIHDEVPYEPPKNPEIILNTFNESLEESVNKIFTQIKISFSS